MAVHTEALASGGPAVPARPIVVSPARTLRRIGLDRWTSRLVIVGGLIVIASILGILLVILAETWPLFREPTARLVATLATGQAAAPWSTPGSDAFEVDEYREVAFALTRDGAVSFQPLKGGTPIPSMPVPGLAGAGVTATATLGKGRFVVGTSDGRVLPIEVGFDVTFANGVRSLAPKATFGDAVAVDPEQRRPVLRMAVATTEAGPLTVAQVGPTELVLRSVQERKALVGPGRREEARQTLAPAVEGEITALAIDGRGEDLFLGTSLGQLVRYDLRAPVRPRPRRDGRCVGRSRCRQGAGIPHRRPHARDRRRGRRRVELAGGAGARRRASPDAHPPVRAARGARARLRRLPTRQGVRDRRCAGRPPRGLRHVRPDLADPRHAGRGRAPRRRLRPEGRWTPHARRRGPASELGARQPAPRDHAHHALREGVVRGVSGPRARLAVDRRHGRFRVEVQPHPADLRHAQGHVLRPPVRGAALAPGGRVRERVHAPGHQELREAGRWRSWPRCRASCWASSRACGWRP